MFPPSLSAGQSDARYQSPERTGASRLTSASTRWHRTVEACRRRARPTRVFSRAVSQVCGVFCKLAAACDSTVDTSTPRSRCVDPVVGDPTDYVIRESASPGWEHPWQLLHFGRVDGGGRRARPFRVCSRARRPAMLVQRDSCSRSPAKRCPPHRSRPHRSKPRFPALRPRLTLGRQKLQRWTPLHWRLRRKRHPHPRSSLAPTFRLLHRCLPRLPELDGAGAPPNPAPLDADAPPAPVDVAPLDADAAPELLDALPRRSKSCPSCSRSLRLRWKWRPMCSKCFLASLMRLRGL